MLVGARILVFLQVEVEAFPSCTSSSTSASSSCRTSSHASVAFLSRSSLTSFHTSHFMLAVSVSVSPLHPVSPLFFFPLLPRPHIPCCAPLSAAAPS
ncbi:hypothetical protein HETIRDRAFT_171516 [Heterobasidion irregulare TC 32-1]|uniref:Secreted protein n=1 Tax=Heterobasidion irregulare (strain TC 32-1) TaxID=747525 RepID=W4K2C9_HETIT|nr:uncharacterized protein HETIRDRAFT_171516 [Heterobasidion irregulare TC 32-1]ETW79978.1 hypothetical protein HETIRDRAFT_171516 [Heterobasidion irregulare TC 32-1]